MRFSSPRPALSLLLALVLGACATAPPPVPGEAPLRSGNLRNFSGNWEKNYQLSDDFATRFGLYVADLRRQIARVNQGNLQGGPVFSSGGGINPDAINGLARFTEELTRMPLMEIIQDEAGIEIERENDFTLRCEYRDRQFISASNEFGSDLCGWTDERLRFQMNLAGGLSIAHQFSLSPDASLLNVTTTVSAAGVSVPLVISNFYSRFTRAEQEYDCVLTLTRSTVCSQRGNTP